MSEPVLALPEIRTERLLLRPLRLADAALIGLYAGDARIARMTVSIPHPYPPGLAETFVERIAAGRGPERVWAIDAGAEGENGMIGLIELTPTGGGAGEFAIGYWIAPAFWGTGYASEAVEAISDHALRAGALRLLAEVTQDNAPAARVLTRGGYDYLGPGETYVTARAALTPTFRYARARAA